MVDWGVIQSGGNRKLPVALHYQLQLQWPIDLDCPSGDKCARHWCFLCQPSRPRADKSADLANHKLSALVQHLIESQSHQKNLAKKWRSPAINPCGKVWIESMKVAFCAWKSSAQLPHQKWPAAADFIFYTNSSPKATCHIQVSNKYHQLLFWARLRNFLSR